MFDTDPPPFLPADGGQATHAFAWDYDIARAILYPLPQEHARLVELYGRLQVRACLCAVLCTLEWAIWSVAPRARHAGLRQRMQAAYVGLAQPQRVRSLPEELEVAGHDQDAEGVLEAAAIILARAWSGYVRNDLDDVADAGRSAALLARHVVSQRKAFSDWLAAALRQAARDFRDAQTELPQQAFVPADYFATLSALSQEALQHRRAALVDNPANATNPWLGSADGARDAPGGP